MFGILCLFGANFLPFLCHRLHSIVDGDRTKMEEKCTGIKHVASNFGSFNVFFFFFFFCKEVIKIISFTKALEMP